MGKFLIQTVSLFSDDDGAGAHLPRRQCVGCRTAVSPVDRLRIVVDAAGRCCPDLRGCSVGRGAWVHARSACLQRAAAAGLSRSFKRSLRVDASDLAREIRAVAEGEVRRLLQVNWPMGRLITGAESLQRCHAAGELRLVIAAAGAVTQACTPWLLGEDCANRLIFWGTEDCLNTSMGLSAGERVTLVGVTHPQLALALRRSAALGRLTVDLSTRSAQKAVRRGDRPVEVQ